MNLNFDKEEPVINWNENSSIREQVAQALNTDSSASDIIKLLSSFKLTWASDVDENLMSAYKCYRNRKLGTERPSGHSDNNWRWYPSAEERRPCCDYIYSPSTRYPNTLLRHCRTINHIANLFNVDLLSLKKLINLMGKL